MIWPFLYFTPKPQDCLSESNVPGLSLQIFPGTCNWYEIQEKKALHFACTRVTCFTSDIAKKCFADGTLHMLLVDIIVIWIPNASIFYTYWCPHYIVIGLLYLLSTSLGNFSTFCPSPFLLQIPSLRLSIPSMLTHHTIPFFINGVSDRVRRICVRGILSFTNSHYSQC